MFNFKFFAAVFFTSSVVFAQIRGFSADQLASEKLLETKLRAVPDAARIRAYAKRMSSVPHHAGSPASKAVAEYALGLFKEWGLDAHIETYEALMPYPAKRVLELIEPTQYVAKLKEPAIPEDPDSGQANQLPTYNAYSASGSVTAPLVYVNYGVPEDYEALQKLGIDVKGKIVIARYGQSWRGVKPKVAHEHGALACIIYSDPRDDGYFEGDVYPKGPFRPPQGVQRGSVIDMSLYPGDPLTPGWASEKGAKRLSREEAKSLLKIPVLPISYGDAQPLLAALGGPVAPENWRGALPFTYHVGPGPAKVRMILDFDWAIRPLYDVIATLPGNVWNDQWVIYGNHHDAWVNGAGDPISGASALLETARTLGAMYKDGWRPKRTITFALWDGEEFGLLGSTEWVEKHQGELAQRAVAYINSDSTGRGTLGAAGSPTLEQFVTEVLRDVPDPSTPAKSVLETARAKHKNEFHLSPLGSGSDFTAFVDHAGVASLSMGFGGDDPGGVYHSIYDSFTWYARFSDGDYKHGRALSQVMGISLVRLADAPVLPFEFGTFAKNLRVYMEEIQKLAGASKHAVEFGDVSLQVARLEAMSKNYEETLAGLQAPGGKPIPERLARLNKVLYNAESAMSLSPGLPGRPWFKNQICAPGMYTGYGAKTLPGVREAVEAGRWDEANAQARNVAAGLKAFNAQLDEATKMLRSVTD